MIVQDLKYIRSNITEGVLSYFLGLEIGQFFFSTSKDILTLENTSAIKESSLS